MKRSRIAFGFAAGLGTVAILMAGSQCHADKKDDRPAGPVASLAPSAGSLKAEFAPPLDLSCDEIVPKTTLVKLTGAQLRLDKHPGNTTRGIVNDQYCDFNDVKTGLPLAQTVYEVRNTEGLKLYKAIRDGKDEFLDTTPIPAAQLPFGVTDGFEFVPAPMPSDLRLQSVFQNAGVTLRVGNQTVTVSAQGYDKLSATAKHNLQNNAIKALFAAHKG